MPTILSSESFAAFHLRTGYMCHNFAYEGQKMFNNTPGKEFSMCIKNSSYFLNDVSLLTCNFLLLIFL